MASKRERILLLKARVSGSKELKAATTQLRIMNKQTKSANRSFATMAKTSKNVSRSLKLVGAAVAGIVVAFFPV